MPTPQVTVTGTIQDLTGIANVGTAVFELENYGSNVPRIAGTSILAQVKTTVVANGNGVFSVTLWGNDVISPGNTYYTVTFLSASGSVVATVPYSFTGSGTVDLSSQAPLSVFPTAAIANAVLTNPTGIQNIIGFGLGAPSIILGDGLISAPALTFANESTTGLYRSNSQPSDVRLAAVGVDFMRFRMGSNQIIMTPASVLGFASTGVSGPPDTALSRSASGVIAVGNGTSGDITGSVKAAKFLAGDGTVTQPSLGFSGVTGLGFYHFPASQDMVFAASGADQILYASLLQRMAAGTILGWSGNADPTLAVTDTGLFRSASGVLSITTSEGAPNASGSLKATTLTALQVASVGASALMGNSLGAAYIDMSGGTGGNGGYIQATNDASNVTGYGTWITNNAFWNGTSWIQPRGVGTSSTGFTASHHKGFSFNRAAASGTNNSAITWTELANLNSSGNLTIAGQYQVGGVPIAASNLSNGVTGSGAVVLANSPTLITPVIGAATGSSLTLSGTLQCATVTVSNGIPRTTLDATGKGWQFIGTATGSGVTVGPVTTTGTFQQYMIRYQIKGYSGGTPVGRFLCGNTTPSTTALTNSFSISEGVTAPTTGAGATAIPGLPLAVTLSNTQRSGTIFIDGASGAVKVIDVIGTEQTPSVATAPTLYRGASFFSDLGTNLPLKQFQLTVYDTLTAVAASSNTFVTGAYITVWGRNND